MTPVAALLPYLERHLAPHTGSARYAAVSELAKRSGVGVRELKRILAGQVEKVDFETADGLLTALGCPELWQTDAELGDIYNAPPKPVEAVPLPTPNGNGRLLTAAELADYLGLSTATVLDRWERGDLPGFRLFGRKGGPVRFRLSEVEAELESWRRGPAPCQRPESVA